MNRLCAPGWKSDGGDGRDGVGGWKGIMLVGDERLD